MARKSIRKKGLAKHKNDCTKYEAEILIFVIIIGRIKYNFFSRVNTRINTATVNIAFTRH